MLSVSYELNFYVGIWQIHSSTSLHVTAFKFVCYMTIISVGIRWSVYTQFGISSSVSYDVIVVELACSMYSDCWDTFWVYYVQVLFTLYLLL